MANNFSSFMKANKRLRANIKYPATKSLLDDNGEPLMWELRPVSTAMNDSIREVCTVEVPMKGKNMYRQKVNTSEYMARLICASVVYPDLTNKELQNSYGTANPWDLLKEMVDDPGEYTEFLQKVQEISGFTTLQEDIDEAKN